MKQPFIYYCFSGFMFLLVGAAQAADSLLSDLDIPLMADFQEVADSRMVFDTPEGRIIEVLATGPRPVARVVEYYRLVLPSLAWQSDAAAGRACTTRVVSCLVARREGEILTLSIQPQPDKKAATLVFFALSPE